MIPINARSAPRRSGYRVLACVSVIVALAACGGGGASVGGATSGVGASTASHPSVSQTSHPSLSQPSPASLAQPSLPSTNQPTPSPHAVPVQLTYVLPARGATASSERRLQYISSSNTSISITVTPLGGSGTTYSSPTCSTVSCAISFTAIPGPTAIVFTLTDGTNTLSSFSTTTIIQPTTQNTLNFTANPVVNSVSLSLASSNVNGGTATNDLLTINAKDFDNKTIVGNQPYVDVNGNRVALVLSVKNAQAGGNGTVTIQGPTRITAPSQAAIYAHYDGKWLASASISVAATSSAITSLTATTLTTIPTSYELVAGLSNPYDITTGPDGAIWYAMEGSSRVGRITTAGTVTSYSAINNPAGLITGPDGNIWNVDFGSAQIERRTTSGSAVPFSAGVVGPNAITNGPDGALWYAGANSNQIGRITPNGSVTVFAASGTSIPTRIAAGADGNLWYTDGNSPVVSRMTTTGQVTNYTTTCTGAFDNWGITAGPDGNMWFTERVGNCIGRLTLAGVLTEFTSANGLTVGAHPTLITNGPDGALWFGEDQGNKLGRITTAGVITEYGNGITAGASPQGITLGPDGNIWFTEFNGGRVGKFVY